MATRVTIERMRSRPDGPRTRNVGALAFPLERIRALLFPLSHGPARPGFRGAGIEPASSAHRTCSTVKLAAVPLSEGNLAQLLFCRQDPGHSLARPASGVTRPLRPAPRLRSGRGAGIVPNEFLMPILFHGNIPDPEPVEREGTQQRPSPGLLTNFSRRDRHPPILVLFAFWRVCC